MLEQFKDKNFGKLGTPKRDKLENGYENFKIGAMILEARLEKGLTQEELAMNLMSLIAFSFGIDGWDLQIPMAFTIFGILM